MFCFCKIQCKTAGRTLCRAAIEGRRHISALQTESTFFTLEICAKKALHKMQKVCYNDIVACHAKRKKLTRKTKKTLLNTTFKSVFYYL